MPSTPPQEEAGQRPAVHNVSDEGDVIPPQVIHGSSAPMHSATVACEDTPRPYAYATPTFSSDGYMVQMTKEMFDKLTKSTEPVLVKHHPINWTGFQMFNLSDKKMDNWFSSFESRLLSAEIPKSAWGKKFIECPKVPEDLRIHLREKMDAETGRPIVADYEAIRKHILGVYGPMHPMGYFSSLLWKVQGNNKEDVLRELRDIRILYNRAARDAKRPVFNDADLLYPFIKAFPEEQQAKLEEFLGEALRRPEDEQLFMLSQHAPSKAQLAKDIETMKEAAVAAIQPKRPMQRQFQRREGAAPYKPRACAWCGRAITVRRKATTHRHVGQKHLQPEATHKR